ncbi:MAG: hypothetical protein D6723_19675 [Acidobacteria bacterium]|nr:MAG: hypothetical protein D6723_19675 [Acidobacteriota bacterium]
MVRDGKVVKEVPLRYAGRMSTYEGRLTPTQAGTFDLEVLAMDPSRANFGMATRPLTVKP